MSDFDNLLFDTIREFGIYIPDDIGSVETMDRVFYFNLCIQCLAILDETILDNVGFVADEDDISHSKCSILAAKFIHLGYTMEIGFSHFLFPEAEDILCELTWLTSSISSCVAQSKQNENENGTVESDQILQCIRMWCTSKNEGNKKSFLNTNPFPIPNQILLNDDEQIIHERLRFQWRDHPSKGIDPILADQNALSHLSFQRIQLSTVLAESVIMSEEVASLQSDLIKYNRIFYTRAHNAKQWTRKIDSLKRNIDELNKMIEFTEISIFEKKKIIAIVDDIDIYLQRIHYSCNIQSSDNSKEEYLFYTKKEEINQFLDDLEKQKHVLWEDSQNLLNHIQINRYEIEGISAVISDRKYERDCLIDMLNQIPKQSFREGYLNRLSQLSTHRIHQQQMIDNVSELIISVNTELKEMTERVFTEENQIEIELISVSKTKQEGSTLLSHFSQMKRLFNSFVSVLCRLMESEDQITNIHIQVNRIDVPRLCRNFEYLVKDVIKIKKENELLLKKVQMLEKD